MAAYLFLVVVALVLIGLLLSRWMAKANPAQVLRVLRRIAIAVVGTALLVLAVRGRLNAALMLAPALLPLLYRWRALGHRAKAARGPSGGQHSDVETRFLRMRLDHDTGAMQGEVIEGRYAGQTLDQLGLEQLLELWSAYCQEDEPSASVLESYLDRTHGDTWREIVGRGSASTSEGRARKGSGSMTREEALKVLDLSAQATPDEIKAAHRRLMQKIHPDQGGSTYLAAKINQAKEVLLGE